VTITRGQLNCDGCVTRWSGSWQAAHAAGWKIAEPDPKRVGEDYCPRCLARRAGEPTPPLPEPTDLPATRRAAVRDAAEWTLRTYGLAAAAQSMRALAERYPEHDTVDPTVSVRDDGWLSVTWPDGVTGPVLVQPGFVHRMVEAQNGMLHDLADARAEVGRLKRQLSGRTSDAPTVTVAIGDMDPVREALEQAAAEVERLRNRLAMAQDMLRQGVEALTPGRIYWLQPQHAAAADAEALRSVAELAAEHGVRLIVADSRVGRAEIESAEIERLRGLLGEAVDGWELEATRPAATRDGLRSRPRRVAEIRRAEGLT
jgi:hypothetical protein